MAGNSTFRVDPSKLLHPPKVIAEFVKRLTAGLHPVRSKTGTEHGSEPRYILSVLADAQPVDATFRPQGEPFGIDTRDISGAGIGLLHTEAINTEYLALQLTHPEGDQLQTVMRVLWCQPRGHNMYDIGGTFITSPDSVNL